MPAILDRLKPGTNKGPADKFSKLVYEASALGATLPPLRARNYTPPLPLDYGVHGRRQPGPGESFWQYRPYQPGDAPRQIDWRKSGRSDQILTREKEWAVPYPVKFLLDSRPSMRYRHSRKDPLKFTRAQVCLAALGEALLRGGEKLYLPGAGGTATDLHGLMHKLDAHGWNPHENYTPTTRCLIVAASDFLDPLPQIESQWREWAGAGIHEAVLLQILDFSEIDLPFSGRYIFSDPNIPGNETLSIGGVETLREAYRERIEHHCAALDSMARRHGWHLIRHITREDTSKPLLRAVQALGGA